MLTKKKIHQFIDEFTTRYASELSQGKDLRNRYWREMACFETGITHFIIGESYISEDGEKVVKIVNHFDDYALWIEDKGYEEDVFIEHDDEQEYFYYREKRYNSKI